MAVKAQDLSKEYRYGFSDPEQYVFKSRRGLDREIVEQIAPQLHLTADQLKDKLQHGQRLVDIAKDQKISRASLKTIIEKSVNTVIDQQVHAGKIDQKRAALLKTLVEKHPFVTARVLHRQYSSKK